MKRDGWVERLRGLAKALAGAAALGILAACAAEATTDPCETMIQHLSTCGEKAPAGINPSQLNCTDPETSCVANCVTDASCAELKAPYSTKGKPFIACLNSCNQ